MIRNMLEIGHNVSEEGSSLTVVTGGRETELEEGPRPPNISCQLRSSCIPPPSAAATVL